MAEEIANPELPEVGVPLPDFQAVVQILSQLQAEGKMQVYLSGKYSIRFICDISEFNVAYGKRIGGIDKKTAEKSLEDVRMFLQVSIAVGKSNSAEFLERHFFDEQFEVVKGNSKMTSELRAVVADKVNLAWDAFCSDAIRERSKRLASTIGPVLQDLDIEVVSRRQSLLENVDIAAPYLRLRLRYSRLSDVSMRFFPPWMDPPEAGNNGFELDCDESEIDLLLSRLLQAKAALKQSVDAKIIPKT